MHWVNQHSYVLVGLLVLGGAWLVLRRRRGAIRLVALGVVVVVLAAAALFLRTGSGDVRATSDLDRALAHGQPVALEFYSNF